MTLHFVIRIIHADAFLFLSDLKIHGNFALKFESKILIQKMKYIFHISDVHIDIERLENLANSFNVLVRDIVAKGVKDSLLVILGDIFEHKTILTTNDLAIFDNMMRKLQANHIRTIIIVGNHDFNINKLAGSSGGGLASMAENNISLEILTAAYDNVVCLTYTCVHVVDDVEFHVYSIVDGGIPQGGASGRIKIALMHDGVNSAKYDTGQTIEGMRFGVSDFEKYDYTMLGDIHKPQFITPRMAYCGSFVQKNRGEGVDHGYILWDLAAAGSEAATAQSGRFCFIPMKNLAIKILALENKSTAMPDIVEGQTITYVQLWHKKCSGEYVSELARRIKAKYGVLHRVINRDLYEITNKPANPADADANSGFREIDHAACIRDLLKSHSAADIEEVVQMHSIRMQSKNDIHHSNYKINYLTWSNVLCYGENNYINFADINSAIVVLNGKNKYGKSSIIDILIRILFNECERGYKKDIVNKNKQSGSIKISISVPSARASGVSDEYTIEQVMDKNNTHTQHRLCKNGENITKQTIVATYEYINKFVGVGSYPDFINMTTALQNRKFLVDLKDEEMLGLLVKLLNIETDEINREVKADLRNRKRDAKIRDEDLARMTASIAESQKALAALAPSKESITGEIATLTVERDSLNLRVQELNRRYNPALSNATAVNPAAEISQIEEMMAGIPPISPKELVSLECEKAVLSAELASLPCDDSFGGSIEQVEAAEELIKSSPNLSAQISELSGSLRHVVDPTKILADISKKIADISAPSDEEYVGILRRMDEIGNVKFKPLPGAIKSVDIPERDLLELKKLVAQPLPDYDAFAAEHAAALARIKAFDSNYSALRFDAACECCRNNSAVLASFGVDADRHRAADLARLLADRDSATHARHRAAEQLAQAQAYTTAAQAHAAAIENNKLAEELRALGLRRDALRARCDLVSQLDRLECDRVAMLANADVLREIARLKDRAAKIASAQVLVNSYKNFKKTTDLKKSLEQISKKIAAAKMFGRLNLLKSIQQNQAIAGEIARVSAQLSNISADLGRKTEIYQRMLGITAALAEKQNMADELQGKIARAQGELRILNLYQKCVDVSGISQKILADLCGVFNRECNRILHQISDFEIEIAVELPRTMKIYTSEAGVKIPAAMASGYQKFVIDIIMRVVLTTILCGGMSNNMSNPGMLIIDEGFGCLDSKNFTEVAGVLSQLKKNFRCIMIITHIPELKEYADLLLDIQRSGGYSRMTFGADELQAQSMMRMTILEDNAHFAEELAASRVEKNEAQAAKRAGIAEKKSIVLQTKAAKLTAKEAVENIASSSELMRGHLIVQSVNDGMDIFTCLACRKTYKYSEKKVNDHVASVSYKSKHKTYIKSIM